MIDGGGRKDDEPNRHKARRFLQAESAQCAIKLDRFEEPKPTGGEGCQALETLGWLGPSSVARKSPRKSGATGSQLIIGERGAMVCIGATESSGMDYAPCSSRHERISGPAA
jgi:hypothetical protein